MRFRGALVRVAVLLLAAMAAGVPISTTVSAATLSDVPATSPMASDVSWVVGHGVITTWSDGSFRPATTVTRQSMALYLYREFHDKPTYANGMKAAFLIYPRLREIYPVVVRAAVMETPAPATAAAAPTTRRTRSTRSRRSTR